MTHQPPILMWFRRDLRTHDHEALSAAAATGRPVIPLFIKDELVDALGAAPVWRLGLSVAQLSLDITDIGSKLILRSGKAIDVIKAVIKETGATSVYWSRGYDTDTMARDTDLKSDLKAIGLEAISFKGHLLFEPWTVFNKAGSYFKVYTPFWKTVSNNPDIRSTLPAVTQMHAPDVWPVSETLDDWNFAKAMNRGGDIVLPYSHVGQGAALDRLDHFLETAIGHYKEKRDFPSIPATSGLSENLTYGEISPRQIWHKGFAAMQSGAQGAEHFLKELVWREFAYHLMYNFPKLATDNWRPEWDKFEWKLDNDLAELWRRGQTGEPFVDTAMRELYVTGTMHNRLRMIVASYLTKHLRTDWRVGLQWFEECLIDWDPASNAMGWQWVAGCGPDAAPYFRVFNPATQSEKFDKNQLYRNRFLDVKSSKEAMAFYQAIPVSWGMDPSDPAPSAIVSLKEGREAALSAYSALRNAT